MCSCVCVCVCVCPCVCVCLSVCVCVCFFCMLLCVCFCVCVCVYVYVCLSVFVQATYMVVFTTFSILRIKFLNKSFSRINNDCYVTDLERQLAEQKKYDHDLKRKSQVLESVMKMTANEKRKRPKMVRLYRQKAVDRPTSVQQQPGSSIISRYR